jgi:hypothetical protein
MTTAKRKPASPAAARKTAISVPPRLLELVDAAARQRGESRSRFIQRILVEAVRSRRDADVRRRIDALFADEGAAQTQKRDAALFEQVNAWDRETW